MALKAFVADLSSIPEAIHDQYVKTDEGYVLDLEDKDFKNKLAEFRDNNRELFNKNKELSGLAEKYKNIDTEKYEEAMRALEILDQSEDAQLLKDGKWDEVIKKRTENMRNQYDQQLRAKDELVKTLSGETSQYKSQYAELLIETAVTNTVSGIAQPRKGALTDIINRAKRDWTVEDGKLKGKELFNTKGDPMNLEEWSKKLVEDNGYLFEASQGSGSKGSGGRPVNNGQRMIIDKNDPVAVGKHMADIASGKAVVQ